MKRDEKDNSLWLDDADIIAALRMYLASEGVAVDAATMFEIRMEKEDWGAALPNDDNCVEVYVQFGASTCAARRRHTWGAGDDYTCKVCGVPVRNPRCRDDAPASKAP